MATDGNDGPPRSKSEPLTTIVVFETHATSLDNEAGIASGHGDADLSVLGLQQARERGERYANNQFGVVLCSDLRRAYRTAEIAFASTGVPIMRDRRLRECDYGNLNGSPAIVVERERTQRIHHPFPSGESYHAATERVREVLNEFPDRCFGQNVLIVGHRATWYSLEHLLAGVPLIDAIKAPWVWRPGWTYRIERFPIPVETLDSG